MRDDRRRTRHHASLARGAVVGDAVWDRQARVRIRLGPLGMERYCDFLPGAAPTSACAPLPGSSAINAWSLSYNWCSIEAQAPGTELDFDAANAGRLGWVSWVKNAPLGVDPDDTILTL